MNKKYTQPKINKKAFNCPHCDAFSQQSWEENIFSDSEFYFSKSICVQCEKASLWRYKYEFDSIKSSMIYPEKITAPLPNQDMPESVRVVYEEARRVSNLSPRAAAALLRVSLEELTKHLGETEGSLNSRIGRLKKQGLPERAIKGLDIVRINGNEGGSHPGEIDLSGEDGPEIVNKLFSLVNFVVEKTITENKEMDEMFDALPDNKKDGIEVRDRGLNDE